MVGFQIAVLVAVWLVKRYWLYVGCKKHAVGCVLVVCVGRVIVGPILVVTYNQNPGFGSCTLVVRVLQPSYDQSIGNIMRRN